MQLCSAFAHILVVGSTALAWKQEKKDHDQFFKRHFHTLFTEPKTTSRLEKIAQSKSLLLLLLLLGYILILEEN